jgi:hypothetical protein|tara:strand:+ start:997 stop:3102 length:2106 start_codon:yes stop_codon:yes gene_type:complete
MEEQDKTIEELVFVPENPKDELAAYVNEKFKSAEDARLYDEQRWLNSYRQYRGLYTSDTQFTETEKSKVFIKVTKTKVLAAYGQIIDVLFAGQRFPLGVEATRIPTGVDEAVNFDPKEPDNALNELNNVFGFPGDGKNIPRGATQESLQQERRLGAHEDDLEQIMDKLKSGAGLTPTSQTYYPAQKAAKRMEKIILDQLEESNASKHLRTVAFEMALFGTGILKGPFAFDKEKANWDEEGNYSPESETVPRVESVSIWNFYPDYDANNMSETEYVIERHKLSYSELRNLKNRPYFDTEAIDECAEMGYNYERKWWETDLTDNETQYNIDRFEVLEFWGNLDKTMAEAAGLEIPDEYKDTDTLQVNAWVCNNKILRLVVNPFTPKRIPYCAAPYEINPYSFFGVGLAENMSDTQTLMNGFMRMAVDNAVLSGNLVFEIDETNLVPGQDLQVYPGKVFRRQGGAPGQALFGTKYPNVSSENMMMFDKARALADDATGIPSYSHGQTGVAGTGRTAAGISMLMGAAQLSIKSVVKNLDDYLLQPLGEALFAFNMQFDFDPEARGDLEIKARGTESLMKNEVRSQRLLQLLQMASNAAVAPYLKIPVILRELGHAMDLDSEKLINDEREAFKQAEILKAAGGLPQKEQAQGINPNDPSGGGGANIGVGQAPVPGEQGFSAPQTPAQGPKEPDAAAQLQQLLGGGQ